MKTVAILLIMSLAYLHADDITLTDGTVFKNATIVSHNDKSATLAFDDGVAMVKIEKLPASALLKIVTQKPTPSTTDAAAAPTTNSNTDVIPPPPAVLDPRIVRATDAIGTTAEGNILHITPKGVVVRLDMISTHTIQIPHHEEHTVDLVPTGLGHTPVNQTVSKDWITLETETEKTSLGLSFVNCTTDGLIDGQLWSGKIWRIGTYSFDEAGNMHHTVARYTAIPQEAYAYFSAHPDQIQSVPPPPADDTPAPSEDIPLDPKTSLSVEPMH